MISNIIALAVYPILAILAFCHKYATGSFDKEFFAKRQTTTLKGIMIFVVFFHHFSHIVAGTVWFERAYRNGQYCIAVFFLLAGYTSCLRYIKADKIDFKKVWINRCWRLYLPIIILSVPVNSFMDALLFFFICTDIAFARIKSDKLKILALFLCNIIFVVICMIVGQGEYWYDDVLTYWIGAIIAFYKKDIVAYFVRFKYWITLIMLTIVFVASYVLAFNWKHYAYSTMILSTSGALIIFMLMMKLNLRSSVFEFIGRYSFEIFMSHQLIIRAMNRLFMHNSVVLFSSMLLTITFSVLLQRTMLKLKSSHYKAKQNGSQFIE